ncbi:hypothetical protein L3Q82_022178 [Scortum barcoo]|uniref:Uncharacterized protein n=1 Tax=Scortum barcoo TaxID=214431 RepID=A0ACB8X140_9TELE|nr:hypothetical protein L3Q82_022178 [Scortum barcoo]
MAEGRGKAAMSREEERCSPSCSGEGWAIQRASLPRSPLLTHALCPISRLSGLANGVQLCCQSIRNSTWPTVQGTATTVNELLQYYIFKSGVSQGSIHGPIVFGCLSAPVFPEELGRLEIRFDFQAIAKNPVTVPTQKRASPKQKVEENRATNMGITPNL